MTRVIVVLISIVATYGIFIRSSWFRYSTHMAWCSTICPPCSLLGAVVGRVVCLPCIRGLRGRRRYGYLRCVFLEAEKAACAPFPSGGAGRLALSRTDSVVSGWRTQCSFQPCSDSVDLGAYSMFSARHGPVHCSGRPFFRTCSGCFPLH